MPKKKKKKAVEKVDAPPPEDPLTKITTSDMDYYNEYFKIKFDKDNMGEITADQIIEIMEELSDEKVDKEKI